jgi:hypothetical protein
MTMPLCRTGKFSPHVEIPVRNVPRWTGFATPSVTFPAGRGLQPRP